MANGQPQEPAKEETKPPIPVQIIVAPAAPGAMKTAEPLPVREVPKTIREQALLWLTKEGPVTVLLFVIVLLLAVGVPKYVIPAVLAGYERQAATYERTLKMQIDARDGMLKQTWDEHGRDREAFREGIRDRRP